ncbi:acetyl-CoA carboxylase, biotin carboxyl carrier protein [Brevibacillus agri]|uniref:Biotin carboxyl carrier protein of acetyl-CoA carboxylase n=1 Tax=Brevibacillus agri TaxID=51101 RepID=A0A3M8AAD6_9BACL|nr:MULTISPECIES: acetyl-CoA carboxylase biotin carboxyl carrier protein [Brevibacillus]MBG9567086.1 acetyl-CoA carboxylase [Brevibacillus agri]MCG5252122.1 acetyl-CoA carboxylase biotin carboxyl carrier protein [Brevibacillus agri]MDN4091214.1 acetyl-CoA carboxylase biotin carboxyl carrier protein [Brevibacillus agri]MED1825945.1 acetyl-CoA carboxylase biotin carboxyl carrier protein [Brevibacillus agri]MED3497727.1 acetyl-CoA carboxylase biotin carboxyl carrier protein [Brevibacillus agri]
MLTIYELRELVKLLEQTDIESLEVKDEESRLRIKRRTNETATADKAAYVQKTEPGKKAAAVVALPQPEKAPVQQPKPQPVAVAVAEKVAPAAVAEQTESLHKITSPMVGTFYAAPAEDAPPYVSAGDRVEPSSIVCIVEAMKLFNEIEAEVKGEIVQVLVENGQLVEHGQPLFLVKLA